MRVALWACRAVFLCLDLPSAWSDEECREFRLGVGLQSGGMARITGCSAWKASVRHGRDDVVALLLDARASPSVTSSARSPAAAC